MRNDKKALDFWRDIIYKNGKLDEEQVLKELFDYYFLMQQVPKVYCHITAGRLSKLMYSAETIISLVDDYINDNYVHKDDLKELMK